MNEDQYRPTRTVCAHCGGAVSWSVSKLNTREDHTATYTCNDCSRKFVRVGLIIRYEMDLEAGTRRTVYGTREEWEAAHMRPS